jgi:hypothetical protein
MGVDRSSRKMGVYGLVKWQSLVIPALGIGIYGELRRFRVIVGLVKSMDRVSEMSEGLLLRRLAWPALGGRKCREHGCRCTHLARVFTYPEPMLSTSVFYR